MTKHSKPADAYHPWSTYIDAREEARRRGERKVGTEHLILGLLRDPVLVLLTVLELERPDPAAELIAALGVDRATVRQRLGVGRAAVLPR